MYTHVIRTNITLPSGNTIINISHILFLVVGTVLFRLLNLKVFSILNRCCKIANIILYLFKVIEELYQSGPEWLTMAIVVPVFQPEFRVDNQ